MRPDGDGRHCERCQLRVTEVATLDGAGLDQLVGAAARGRVCASFEMEAGRPRTKLGLVAGLVVITLAGCATPSALAPPIPTAPESAMDELSEADAGSEKSGGVIAGVVRSPEGSPIVDAIVILQSVALAGQQERMTDERGVYEFHELPAGNYTIQVLYQKANVSKITALPENARFRANFKIDPTNATEIVLQVLAEVPVMPARKLPIGATRSRVTGVVVRDNNVDFDSGFVSAGLRIGE